MGAGKTYTIEEWKAIFDAKLEKKRQQIEAREAKKKQVMLLDVRADDDNPDSAPFWRTVPIPLETTRPFKYKQMSLTECARAPVEEGGLGPDWTDNQAAAAAKD